MNFLIAETFTDSLARLMGEEQKAVKTTAFNSAQLPVPGDQLQLTSRNQCPVASCRQPLTTSHQPLATSPGRFLLTLY